MKKVVLMLVFLFALTGSFANSFNGNDIKSSTIENVSIEKPIDNVVINDLDFESLSTDLMSFTSNDVFQLENSKIEIPDYYVRYCIYINGRKYCTDWEYVIELDGFEL
jgi:hypothetical protein